MLSLTQLKTQLNLKQIWTLMHMVWLYMMPCGLLQKHWLKIQLAKMILTF